MKQNNCFITINHTEEFGGTTHLRVGDKITLKKDHDNIYDDEAVVAYGKHGTKCGYVANSVSTVARGTYSAGRLYDKIDEEGNCVIRFILEDCLIAEIV